ncbi:uncharacterized protein LOC130700389 [Daphnia carinata]|uniref:uncharacterized protein LOC130700389 n=1 Tax=Daphnia carinata TaxID=120202 RepID=UPI00257C6849|nr:uncharacterized protein LOC130700389 [Daphnia carinata]
MNFTTLIESRVACLLLLQFAICCAGPIAVKSRNLVIPRVTRSDPSLAQDYQQFLADNGADLATTTVDPFVPTTEGLLVADVINADLIRIEDQINPFILATDQKEEPVASDAIPTDFASFVDFQDTVETVSHDGQSAPVEEDPTVDSRITSAINAEAPAIDVSQSVLSSDPVDFLPILSPSVEPASPVEPIFIAHVLPLEPVVSSPEKVEISSPNRGYPPVMDEAFNESDDALLQPYYPSSGKVELRDYFPNRPFGSLPKPRELGFPPVSNTRENVMRDVNWQAKIGRAYRSS